MSHPELASALLKMGAAPYPRVWRLGLIGLGRVAWLLENDRLRQHPCSHLGAWLDRGDIQLVAGCDLSVRRNQWFRDRYPEARLYRTYADMLAQERLDVLSICAYAPERMAMTLEACQQGVRGIWCEKAMSCSLAEAEAMEQALAASGTQMIVSFMRRWEPRYLKVRALLEEGAIGELESINVHFASNLLHTGTHAFDVIRLWCGEIEWVQAWLEFKELTGAERASLQSGYRFQKSPLQDIGGFALLRTCSGVMVSIHAHEKSYFRFEFELLGRSGMIRIGNAQAELWQLAQSPRFTGFTELARMPFPEVEPVNMWNAACNNLVQAMRGIESPACGATDGRQALAIGLAMHWSHHQGHRPVRLDEVPRDLRVSSR